MEQTLDTKDIQVLDTGKVFSISSQDSNYAYLGGDFSTNPNDYVEILIYDTNNNFLESSTVDESDYKSNPETGLKINTGTVLRKLGYDRGRYVVKYNFFRRAAGSNETVLVNTDGTIYTGEPIINSDGTISDTNNNKLLVKENKYYVHEISDSRSELRLAPEKINDVKYNDDFLKVQTERNYIKIENGVRFVAVNSEKIEDSVVLQTPPNQEVSKDIIGGILSINNAFVEKIIPPPGSEEDTGVGKDGETDDQSGRVDARFYIKDLSSAYPRSENQDLYFTRMYDGFKGVTTIQELENKYGTGTGADGKGFTIEDESLELEGIRNLDDEKWRPFELVHKSGRNNLITLKSITTRPLNLEAHYRWELSGYDRDGNSYERIVAGEAGNSDVQWTTPFGGNSRVIEGVGVDEASFAITSGDCHVGVRLTVTVQDVAPSTIIYPVVFETDEDR